MHPRTSRRPDPYVWVTWITKILAGECSCTWSAWHRAHHYYAKVPSDFDLGAWQMDHTALLRKSADDFRKNGFGVQTESQNSFTLKGKVGTLAGKPDIVAIQDQTGWVVDVKTGTPKASDRIQVMVYMWALPKAHSDYGNIKFDGKVVYNSRYNLISAEEIDAKFKSRVGELMKEVCGSVEPHKAPSFGECKYCSITKEDCEDRVETEMTLEGETDEF